MIMRYFASSFFLLAAAAGSADAVAPSFLPRKSLATSRALELRGGAGPIEAETAAKVVGGLAIATGSVFFCR